MEEEVDLTNNLPYALLSGIVSFLPGGESVRTSILSKRWKDVWKYSSHLSFNQRNMLKPLIETYLQGTDSVMRLLLAISRKEGADVMDSIGEASILINSIVDNHVGPLKSCRIQHLCESCASGDVMGWISKLLEKGVKKVTMVLEPNYLNEIILPSAIINAALTLDFSFEVFFNFEEIELMNYRLTTSSSPAPPQILKTLTLNNVNIEEDLNELLSHCTSLENLTLDKCQYFNVVKINSQSLKKFKICNMFICEINLIAAVNIEVIEIDSIIGNPQDVVFEIPKRLQVLRAYTYSDIFEQYLLINEHKVLTGRDIIEICGGLVGSRRSSMTNMFENLDTLCLDLDLENTRNSIALSFALKSCHQLKNLQINNKIYYSPDYYSIGMSDHNDDDCLPYPRQLFWQRREPCDCTNNQLKSLCIRGFRGRDFELEFVKYIIINSRTIDKITIWFVDDCSWVEVAATMCLLSYPRSSTKLSIDVKPGANYMTKVGGSFTNWVTTLRD